MAREIGLDSDPLTLLPAPLLFHPQQLHQIGGGRFLDCHSGAPCGDSDGSCVYAELSMNMNEICGRTEQHSASRFQAQLPGDAVDSSFELHAPGIRPAADLRGDLAPWPTPSSLVGKIP